MPWRWVHWALAGFVCCCGQVPLGSPTPGAAGGGRLQFTWRLRAVFHCRSVSCTYCVMCTLLTWLSCPAMTVCRWWDVKIQELSRLSPMLYQFYGRASILNLFTCTVPVDLDIGFDNTSSSVYNYHCIMFKLHSGLSFTASMNLTFSCHKMLYLLWNSLHFAPYIAFSDIHSLKRNCGKFFFLTFYYYCYFFHIWWIIG